MKIEVKKLSEISPYFNNPRDARRAINPTRESIGRYGFIKPILVDKNLIIIAGHTRYIAAYQLGMEYVPVVVSDMDEEHARRYRIADNIIAEKSYYDDQLIEELKKLSIPEDMQVFFQEDLSRMLNFSIKTINDNADIYGGFKTIAESEEQDSLLAREEDNVNETIKDDVEKDYIDCYKIKKREDGSTYMKCFCPECGNIDIIEITD